MDRDKHPVSRRQAAVLRSMAAGFHLRHWEERWWLQRGRIGGSSPTQPVDPRTASGILARQLIEVHRVTTWRGSRSQITEYALSPRGKKYVARHIA